MNDILAKRPTGGGFDFGSVPAGPEVRVTVTRPLSRNCRSFFEPRVDRLLGARRSLNQVLEGIDVCIAQKAEQTPSVEAFLQKY